MCSMPNKKQLIYVFRLDVLLFSVIPYGFDLYGLLWRMCRMFGGGVAAAVPICTGTEMKILKTKKTNFGNFFFFFSTIVILGSVRSICFLFLGYCKHSTQWLSGKMCFAFSFFVIFGGFFRCCCCCSSTWDEINEMNLRLYAAHTDRKIKFICAHELAFIRAAAGANQNNTQQT